jgi:hypothetical protein
MTELGSILNQVLPDAFSQMLGEDATYTPTVGAPVVVRVFPVPADLAENFTPNQYTLRWVRVSDLGTQPIPGDTMTIGATVYDVTQIQHQPEIGTAYLILSKA